MNREELVISIKEVLLNSRGAIDSNKIRSPNYAPIISEIQACIIEDIPFNQKVYLLLRGLDSVPMCPCGSIVKWQVGAKKFSQYCSVKCSANSTETKEKQKTTNNIRYGVDHTLSSKTVRDKISITNNRRYGGNSPMSSPLVIDRVKKTNRAIYGFDNPMQNIDIQNKKKETNLKIYGTTSPLHNKDIIKKSLQTMVERYGVEYFLQNPESYAKFRKKMIESYGVPHALLNQDLLEKSIDSIKKAYGVNNISQHPDIISQKITTRHLSTFFRIVSGVRTEGRVEPLFTFEEYTGVDNKYLWKCSTCNLEFHDHLEDGHIPRCKKCYPNQTATSLAEKEIEEELSKYTKVILNDRSLIYPYELDLYLPEYNIAIEYNGLYWHSELSGKKDPLYHLRKSELCESIGIHLIQVFDDEWINKKEIVLSILKSRLGINITKVFARKCKLQLVAKEIEKQFLINNHIQGYSPSSVAIGLYYNNELVMLTTYGKSRYNKNYNYELIRSVTKKGYQVIGGLSKLLSSFRKTHPLCSLISYCDKRFFTGKGYLAVGFKELRKAKPNYFYTKDYKERLSRLQFQKHKLPTLLDEFDASLSEWQNLQLNGYDRIFDAGQAVFVLQQTGTVPESPI